MTSWVNFTNWFAKKPWQTKGGFLLHQHYYTQLYKCTQNYNLPLRLMLHILCQKAVYVYWKAAQLSKLVPSLINFPNFLFRKKLLHLPVWDRWTHRSSRSATIWSTWPISMMHQSSITWKGVTRPSWFTLVSLTGYHLLTHRFLTGGPRRSQK